MTEGEKQRKLAEYSERHQNWTAELLSSLSFTIQIFATIELGLIAFLLSSHLDDKAVPLRFCLCAPDWFSVFYYLCIVFSLLSIFFSLIAIINRVYDFRFTRHVTLVRKRVLEEKSELLSDAK